MPKRILILGLLFLLGGLSALWSIIEAGMEGRIYLNFAVLTLPVGIGLLCGSPAAQWWARFCIVLGYLLVAALACLSLAYPQNARAVWFGTEMVGKSAVPYCLLVSALGAVGLGICHRLLYSAKACAYFSRE